jgi:hypothetical protein
MKMPQRTMPVHALDDERVHLALPHHGLMRQGRLKTLCGLQAVSELPLFAAIEGKRRCKACFAKVDDHGYVIEKSEGATPARRRQKDGGRARPGRGPS